MPCIILFILIDKKFSIIIADLNKKKKKLQLNKAQNLKLINQPLALYVTEDIWFRLWDRESQIVLTWPSVMCRSVWRWDCLGVDRLDTEWIVETTTTGPNHLYTPHNYMLSTMIRFQNKQIRSLPWIPIFTQLAHFRGVK